jgi:hypothetical protein
MYSTRTAVSFALISLSILSSIGAYAQQVRDCRPTKDFPSLSGHWKDDLNGQEVDITIPGDLPGGDVRTTTTFSSGITYQTPFSLVATYSSAEQKCKDPDYDGNPVSFQIDFQGNSGDLPHEILGPIFWCDTKKGDDGKTYTVGVGSGNIVLQESKDGMSLSGHFHGRNGVESISFTRLSKPQVSHAQVVVRATAGAKIYQKPSTNSTVKYTPASGAQLIIESAVELDANGNPTWYAVSNGGAGRVGVNSGYIPAGKVVCPNPSKPGPVSVLRF